MRARREKRSSRSRYSPAQCIITLAVGGALERQERWRAVARRPVQISRGAPCICIQSFIKIRIWHFPRFFYKLHWNWWRTIYSLSLWELYIELSRRIIKYCKICELNILTILKLQQRHKILKWYLYSLFMIYDIKYIGFKIKDWDFYFNIF